MEFSSFRRYFLDNRLILAKTIYSPFFLIFVMVFSLMPMPLSINPAMASSLELGEVSQEFGVEQAFFQRLTNAKEEESAKNIEYLTLEYAEKLEKEKFAERMGRTSEYTPENGKDWETEYVTVRTITAYNSEVAQCDDSPCVTANGFNVCEHGVEDTVAANFLRFGTKIRIPDLFGDRIFIVRDRTNKKYSNRIDIWMLEKADAKQFGVRIAKVEIVQ